MLEELVIRLGLDSRFSDGVWIWVYMGSWTLIPYVAAWNMLRDWHLRDRLIVNVQASIPRILWDLFFVYSRFFSLFMSQRFAELTVIIPMVVLFWPWAFQGIFIGSLRFSGFLKDFSKDLSDL